MQRQIKVSFFSIGVLFMLILSNNILADSHDNSSQRPQIFPELQQLVANDQFDRTGKNGYSVNNYIDWKAVAKRDLMRRKRVKEILAEGHLRSSRDYLAAALIYQHGNTPADYYQAYLWAKKAVELGDNSGKDMVALTIDRYLVSTGRKQLFGSQFLLKETDTHEPCLCPDDVDQNFSDSQRKSYTGLTLQERYDRNMAFFKQKICKRSCDKVLKPVSRKTMHEIVASLFIQK